jgi:hypothetical protein
VQTAQMRHPIIKHGAVTAPLERKSPFLSVSVAGLPGCGRARAGDSRSPAEQRQDHDLRLAAERMGSLGMSSGMSDPATTKTRWVNARTS